MPNTAFNQTGNNAGTFSFWASCPRWLRPSLSGAQARRSTASCFASVLPGGARKNAPPNNPLEPRHA